MSVRAELSRRQMEWLDANRNVCGICLYKMVKSNSPSPVPWMTQKELDDHLKLEHSHLLGKSIREIRERIDLGLEE